MIPTTYPAQSRDPNAHPGDGAQRVQLSVDRSPTGDIRLRALCPTGHERWFEIGEGTALNLTNDIRTLLALPKVTA